MNPLFFLALVSTSLAAIMIYPIKAGEQLMLDLGPNIRTWHRMRNGGKEHIKFCGPTEKNVACAQFVTENLKSAKPASEAHVYENGTLIIDNIKASDAGSYFSDDEPERIFEIPGGYAKTARSSITVVVN